MPKVPAEQPVRFLRFRDLVAMGLVGNWVTLSRWIETENFPPGRYLARNSRAWTESEVEEWIATRPTIRTRPAPTFGRTKAPEEAA
jgi:predicted DNA-binding transcriptional regulator AlpA